MDPASAILMLKGLLDLIPLAMKEVQIARERGEYSDEEWNAVKAQVAAWNTDPAFQIEPDPSSAPATPIAPTPL